MDKTLVLLDNVGPLNLKNLSEKCLKTVNKLSVSENCQKCIRYLSVFCQMSNSVGKVSEPTTVPEVLPGRLWGSTVVGSSCSGGVSGLVVGRSRDGCWGTSGNHILPDGPGDHTWPYVTRWTWGTWGDHTWPHLTIWNSWMSNIICSSLFPMNQNLWLLESWWESWQLGKNCVNF